MNSKNNNLKVIPKQNYAKITAIFIITISKREYSLFNFEYNKRLLFVKVGAIESPSTLAISMIVILIIIIEIIKSKIIILYFI